MDFVFSNEQHYSVQDMHLLIMIKMCTEVSNQSYWNQSSNIDKCLCWIWVMVYDVHGCVNTFWQAAVYFFCYLLLKKILVGDDFKAFVCILIRWSSNIYLFVLFCVEIFSLMFTSPYVGPLYQCQHPNMSLSVSESGHVCSFNNMNFANGLIFKA